MMSTKFLSLSAAAAQLAQGVQLQSDFTGVTVESPKEDVVQTFEMGQSETTNLTDSKQPMSFGKKAAVIAGALMISGGVATGVVLGTNSNNSDGSAADPPAYSAYLAPIERDGVLEEQPDDGWICVNPETNDIVAGTHAYVDLTELLILDEEEPLDDSYSCGFCEAIMHAVVELQTQNPANRQVRHSKECEDGPEGYELLSLTCLTPRLPLVVNGDVTTENVGDIPLACIENGIGELNYAGITQINGNIIIENHQSVEKLSFPDLEIFNGNLIIRNNPYLRVIEFPNLRAVRQSPTNVGSGDVVILNNGNAFTVSSTIGYRCIDGEGNVVSDALMGKGTWFCASGQLHELPRFPMEKNHVFYDLQFPNLEFVVGTMTIRGNSIDLAGPPQTNSKIPPRIAFPRLATVGAGYDASVGQSSGGGLIVTNNNVLGGPISFPALTTINGGFAVEQTSASGLFAANLNSVLGHTRIKKNPNMEAIGLPSLRTASQDLVVFRNEVLDTVNLNRLQEVGGKLQISSNARLGEININTLKGVTGDVKIVKNCFLDKQKLLPNFWALPATTQVGGQTTITDNGQTTCGI